MSSIPDWCGEGVIWAYLDWPSTISNVLHWAAGHSCDLSSLKKSHFRKYFHKHRLELDLYWELTLTNMMEQKLGQAVWATFMSLSNYMLYCHWTVRMNTKFTRFRASVQGNLIWVDLAQPTKMVIIAWLNQEEQKKEITFYFESHIAPYFLTAENNGNASQQCTCM